MRPAIDLSSLNKFIVNEYFQIENISCLKTLLLPDFVTNIDLKDAYLSVPSHKSSRKVPLLHLEGNMLPVESSPIRPVFGPQDFFESFKTCCCIPEEEGHSSPYIPIRFSSPGCNKGGSCETYSTGCDPPSVPRFYNKEIITDFNASDNLPGF